MRQPFPYFITTTLWLAAGLFSHAGRPAKGFSPYLYAGSGDNFQLTHCDDMTGQKFFTLAFIIADPSNNPAWYGRIPMAENFYTNQITALRDHGGDVIVSFGGEGGKELALVETNNVALEAKYQSVIDPYKFTWLDFDIEGKALSNTEANQRRNTILDRKSTRLNSSHLVISYAVFCLKK